MVLFDTGNEIRTVEDSRIFFALSTGHLCKNWGQQGVVDGVMSHGGTCDNCGAKVSTTMDTDAVKNKCPGRTMDLVHDR